MNWRAMSMMMIGNHSVCIESLRVSPSRLEPSETDRERGLSGVGLIIREKIIIMFIIMIEMEIKRAR